ncbi:hypothetical protein [Halomonas sp. WWR20]
MSRAGHERPCRLPLNIGRTEAERRMAHLGASTMELLALPLWAFALRDPGGHIPAHLLTQRSVARVLLWPQALFDDDAWQTPATRLPETAAPAPDRVARAWLWERLAQPRHWSLRLDRGAAVRTVHLPLWLGYRPTRRGMRTLVVSGVSGELLPSLKPAVLAGLSAATVNSA